MDGSDSGIFARLSFDGFARFCWLTALLVFAHWWLVRHLGFSVEKVGLVAIGWSLLALFTKLLSEIEKVALKSKLRVIIGVATDRYFLGLCTVGLTLVVSTRSSIAIQIPPGLGARTCKITSAMPGAFSVSERVSDDGVPVRHGLWVTPLGRDLIVLVEGFVPLSVRVFPLLGAEVTASRLRLQPTLLIRVSEELETSWTGGTVKLHAAPSAERMGDVVFGSGKTSDDSGSVRFGTKRLVPPMNIWGWEKELMSRTEVSSQDDLAALTVANASYLLAWSRPSDGELSESSVLRPGVRLRASFYDSSEILRGETTLIITGDAYQENIISKTTGGSDQ